MKRTALALGAFLALAPAYARAQSAPSWLSYGYTPTAGQWRAAFAAKQDLLPYTPLGTTGGTMSGKLFTAPATVNGSGFAFLPGVAPTAPANGDAWLTSSGFFVKAGGQVLSLLPVGTTAGTVAAGNDSRIVGAVRSDVAQTLTAAQRQQAKQNIGSPFASVRYTDQNVTLTAADMGQIIATGAPVTITLPQVSTVKAGDNIKIHSLFGNGATVARQGTDTLYLQGTNVATAPIYPSQPIEIYSDGAQWIIVGYVAPFRSALNVDVVQSFSATQQVQAFANLGAPPSSAGTVLTSNGTGAAPTFQALPSASAALPLGQVRLTYSSASALLVKPYNGNQITVNGAYQTVPGAGVTCSNAGLAASTLYFAYLYVSGGTLTCEMVTTAHATGANGLEIKSGDATRTLVGMAYTGAGTPGTFVDAPATRYVASWFNRVPRRLYVAPTSGTSASTASPGAEPSSANRINFVSWADAGVGAHLSANMNNSASAVTNTTQLMLDGNLIGDTYSQYIGTGGQAYATAYWAETDVSEGFHYIGYKGWVSSGTGTWASGVGGTVFQ